MHVADDGHAPPLYVRGPIGYPWGKLHGTESLGPGASFRRWKVPLQAPLWLSCSQM